MYVINVCPTENSVARDQWFSLAKLMRLLYVQFLFFNVGDLAQAVALNILKLFLAGMASISKQATYFHASFFWINIMSMVSCLKNSDRKSVV